MLIVVENGPHTAHPIAKINKGKDLSLILLISVKALSSWIFYSQPLNEMFIFSGKSCCNSTFAIYIVANKEYLTRRQIIFRHL